MLVLSHRDVEEALDLERLVDALATAMAEVTEGAVSMPPRVAARVDEREGMLAAMPAHLPGAGALTTKLVSLFPHNDDRPTHQAVIVCFDPANGTPLAVMDGSVITAARTGAGSRLAARYLARPDARRVTIIGAGVQARSHARAFATWPGLESISLTARSSDELDTLMAELDEQGLPVRAAASLAESIEQADIVCATTHASEPVVLGAQVRPGTHVSSVGYNTAGDGEVDVDLVRRAYVVVESREAALAPPPSGAVELHRAIEAGISDPVDAEVGELVLGHATGRPDDDAVTLYKSVGVAAQDAAAAALVLAEAERRSLGQRVDV